MSYKNIAVIGATGAVGVPVIDALLEDSKSFTSVTVLTVNNPSDPKFDSLKAKGVKVTQVDFAKKAELVQALKGVDAIVSTVGATAVDSQIQVIDAAVEVIGNVCFESNKLKAGVKRFIPSEYGCETFGNAKSDPFFASKVRVQEKLEEVSKTSSLTYTLIATGAFFEWGLQNGFLGFDLKSHSVTFYDEGKSPVTFILLKDVGRFIAATLKDPATSKNRSLHLGGFNANQREVLKALEEKTGAKWTVKESVAISDLPKRASDALQKKDFFGYAVNSILSVLYDGRSGFKLENAEFPSVKPHSLNESLDVILKK